MGCPSAWSDGYSKEVPTFVKSQEYATAIRRHEENSSHAACSKHPFRQRHSGYMSFFHFSILLFGIHVDVFSARLLFDASPIPE